MTRERIISPCALILSSAVSGCEARSPREVAFTPEYKGVQTQLLDEDLVSVQVAMTGARSIEDVDAYAKCAAAQFTLIQGYGFARHLRTSVTEVAGTWHGDAVYTISPSLPRGLKTIDAEVTVAACNETSIPTV